jgi:eukaryotic-like serine/threonine-protein kinase
MSDPTWSRVESLVDAVLDLPEAERETRVRDLAGHDVALRDAALTWLRGIARPDSPLEAGLVPLLERAGLTWHAPAPRATDGSAPLIGPWRVVRPLGYGGMGEVSLVEHTNADLPMQAALKRMRGLTALDARGVQRFLEERRLLARLSHPGIARLIDGGVATDGAPWFAMEYVEGERIDHWCRDRQLSVRERVRLMIRVCDAVQHAHQQLIVHRDLKPGNVLVTADGTPRLLDFGIAKLLTPEEQDARDATHPGAAPLSLPYAAPEQLREAPVSTAIDVYALGVLLHLLLTGALPFGDGRDGRLSQERRILEGAATPPSSRVPADALARTGLAAATLVRALRPDLDTIIVHAVNPEPARRYPSAAALGDDLRAWLDHRPLIARRAGAWYRLRKFVQRQPGVVAALVVTIVSLASFAIVSSTQARRIAVERENAEAAMGFLSETLAQVDMHARGAEPPTLRQALDGSAARAESLLVARPGVRGTLLAAIAPAYHTLGAFDRERELLQQAERLQREAFGIDDPRRALTLQQLAQLEMYVGSAELAEAHLYEALRLIRRSGPYRGLTADGLQMLLAAAQFRLGRNATSESGPP